jgi:hypothetical protein
MRTFNEKLNNRIAVSTRRPTTLQQSLEKQVTSSRTYKKQIFFWSTSNAFLQRHQKQHYVSYYLSIVFILSLKYAFGIISMFFTLVRCSIILSRLFYTCLHLCFLPNVQNHQISIRLLMSHEKCPIWKSCLL